VPTGQEDVWAPELIWVVWKGRCLCLPTNETKFFHHAARSPVFPNYRSRPLSGSWGVWHRVARVFYGELNNYEKKKTKFVSN